jgi:hypothetical protein
MHMTMHTHKSKPHDHYPREVEPVATKDTMIHCDDTSNPAEITRAVVNDLLDVVFQTSCGHSVSNKSCLKQIVPRIAPTLTDHTSS